jgi:hypothetical protein
VNYAPKAATIDQSVAPTAVATTAADLDVMVAELGAGVATVTGTNAIGLSVGLGVIIMVGEFVLLQSGSPINKGGSTKKRLAKVPSVGEAPNPTLVQFQASKYCGLDWGVSIKLATLQESQ